MSLLFFGRTDVQNFPDCRLNHGFVCPTVARNFQLYGFGCKRNKRNIFQSGSQPDNTSRFGNCHRCFGINKEKKPFNGNNIRTVFLNNRAGLFKSGNQPLAFTVVFGSRNPTRLDDAKFSFFTSDNTVTGCCRSRINSQNFHR